MVSDDWESMTIDELFALREEVAAILKEKLMAKNKIAEERLTTRSTIQTAPWQASLAVVGCVSVHEPRSLNSAEHSCVEPLSISKFFSIQSRVVTTHDRRARHEERMGIYDDR